MRVAHVLHMAQPVVDDAHARVVQRGRNAAALGVADDDDVAHLQRIDRVLDHRQRVQVGVGDDVGHVAMHEHVARQQADELVGRHAAVGTADPQVLRRLLREQAREEARIALFHARGPTDVLGEEFR